MSISLKLLHNNKHQFIANLYQQDACGWGRGGCRGQRSPPLKPAQVTLFTMILYNSENNIRDIRPFVWSQHCCEVCFISLIVGKSLWDLTTKYFWNRPPPTLLAWSAPVEASRTLSSFINRPASISKLATIVQRFVRHSISVFRFDFLYLKNCTLSHVCLPNTQCIYSAKSFSFVYLQR